MRLGSTAALFATAALVLPAAETGEWTLYSGQQQYEGTLQTGKADAINFAEQDTGVKYDVALSKVSEFTVLKQQYTQGVAPCFKSNIVKITLMDHHTVLTGCNTPYAMTFIAGARTIYLDHPERTDFRVVRKK